MEWKSIFFKIASLIQKEKGKRDVTTDRNTVLKDDENIPCVTIDQYILKTGNECFLKSRPFSYKNYGKKYKT